MNEELIQRAVAIFNDGHSMIVVDDHCYVIMNWNGETWVRSAWIFKEALGVLKSLPDDPDDALLVSEDK